MKLAELFGKGRTVFSCEVFPPKKTSPVDSIYKTLDGLRDIHPDFILSLIHISEPTRPY